MAAALAEVRGRLGDDAVILHTRTLRRGGWRGWGGRNFVEITAAKSITDLPSSLRRGILKNGRGDVRDVVQTLDRGGQGRAEGAAEPMVAVKDMSADSAPRRVLAELHELKSLVHDLTRQSHVAPTPALPAELLETYTTLLENEVAREIADGLVARVRGELSADGLRDGALVRRKLADYVESMLPEAGGIELTGSTGPTVIALVGPTGVGKTTTVAKLAADFSLRQGRKVGLITIDTHRIAAVDQLRTYAEIIDVPLEVVLTPEELPAALKALDGCEVVFVDTTGRSPCDEVRLRELHCYLAEAPAHEVHLVLSATSSRRVLEQALEKFADLGVNRVIFTKLDEAVGFGVMLTCLHQAQARLSYVTTGQDVASAIESGAARRIAQAIVGRFGNVERQ